MKRSLPILAALVISQCLFACSNQVTHPATGKRAIVSASHSLAVDSGMLKVFSDPDSPIFSLYVRPLAPGRWVTNGGGGGNDANPWHHSSSVFWALGDEQGWFPQDAPRKAFNCLFDGDRMTLTLETGTYAVHRGDLIVIALDENWRPSIVRSGVEALAVFDLSQNDRQRLIAHAGLLTPAR